MSQNTYTYVSKFFKLLNVKFFHNFYKDNLLKGISFSADQETSQLLDSHGIIFRYIENGFTLISKSDPKFESLSYSGKKTLIFNFKINLSNFLNFTDIPYNSSQKLIFQNIQDQSNEKLHSGFFVDNDNIKTHEKDGIVGQISLTINSKNQFFGSQNLSNKKNELNYSIHFNSRKIKFRYNFYSSNQLIDFSSYFITDEQNSIKIDNYKTRTLASGLSVFYIAIDEPIFASENYSKKLYLKKEDNLLSPFSLFLPYPKAENISFDEKENLFFNDVYVKI